MAFEEIGLKAVVEGAQQFLANLGLMEKAEQDLGKAGTDVAAKQKEVNTSFSDLGKQTLVAVGAFAAVAGSLEAFNRSQQESTTAVRRLGVETGLTSDVIRKLAIDVGETGSSLTAIVKVMELGAQQGVLGAEALKNYASFWQLVAHATDNSVESLARQGVALQAVGIAVEDDASALAAFGYIQTQTTIGVDGFLSILQRKAPAIIEMGLTVDQLAAAIGILTDRGLTGRAAMSTLTNAISDSGGTLDGFLAALGVGAETFAQYEQAVANSSTKIEELAAANESAYTPLQKIQYALDELLFRWADQIAVMAGYVQVLSGVPGAIKLVEMAWNAGAAALALLTTAMGIHTGVAVVNTAAMTAQGNAALVAGAEIDTYAGAEVAAGTAGATGAVGVGAFATAMLAVVGPALLVAAALAATAVVVYEIQQHWDDLSEAMERHKTITAALALALGLLMSPLVITVATIEILYRNWDHVTGALEAASDAFSAIVGPIGDAIDALTPLADTLADADDGFVDFVGTVVDDGGRVIEWFDDLDEHVSNGLDAFVDAMESIGGDAMRAFKDGLVGGWEDTWGWITEHLNPFNWDFPGHSPADEMYAELGQKAGEALGDGITQGIKDTTPAVVAAAEAMAGEASKPIVGFIAFIRGALNEVARLGALYSSGYGSILPSDKDYIDIQNLLGVNIVGSTSMAGAIDWAKLDSAAVSALSKKSGGGGGAKEAALTAVEEFDQAMAEALQHSKLEDLFGDLGTKALETFSESLSNPKTAASLPGIVQDLIEQATEEGVPNAQELGDALASAIAEGLAAGSSEKVEVALKTMTDAIAEAGKLSVESFEEGVSKAAASKKMEDAIGSMGKRTMDALDKALKEGGKKNLETLYENTANMVEALKDKAPEAQAAYIGTNVMQAMERAIRENSDDAKAALANALRDMNEIMKGGAVDLKTHTIYTAEAIADMAKAFGVSGQFLVENVDLIVTYGLDKLIGKLDQFTEDERKRVAQILQDLEDGKIQWARAAAELDSILDGIGRKAGGLSGGTGGTAGVGSGPPAGNPPGGYTWSYIGGGKWDLLPLNPKPGDTFNGMVWVDEPIPGSPPGTKKGYWLQGGAPVTPPTYVVGGIGVSSGGTSPTSPGPSAPPPESTGKAPYYDVIQQKWITPYALGTPYVPETGLALVHRGEMIIPPWASAIVRGAGGGGGASAITIDLSHSSFMGTPEENASEIEMKVGDAIGRIFGRDAFVAGRRPLGA